MGIKIDLMLIDTMLRSCISIKKRSVLKQVVVPLHHAVTRASRPAAPQPPQYLTQVHLLLPPRPIGPGIKNSIFNGKKTAVYTHV